MTTVAADAALGANKAAPASAYFNGMTHLPWLTEDERLAVEPQVNARLPLAACQSDRLNASGARP
jgi:hypothetical protein